MVRAQRRVVALHRSYLQRLVRAHEEERSRIARDVHDDAVQRLTVIGRELELLQHDGEPLGDDRVRHIGGIQGEVRDLADALRQLAHQLHPAALEHAGLNVALRQLADETTRAHGVNVRVQLPDRELSLSQDVRLALFRIAQEALSNAVRHARTDEVSIRLKDDGAGAELEVEDSGVGFDQRAIGHRGIGLVGIEERARLAGGNAWVMSAPGQGTRVAARIGSARGSR